MRRPILFQSVLLIECTHSRPRGQRTMLECRTIGLQAFSLSPPAFPRGLVAMGSHGRVLLSMWTRFIVDTGL